MWQEPWRSPYGKQVSPGRSHPSALSQLLRVEVPTQQIDPGTPGYVTPNKDCYSWDCLRVMPIYSLTNACSMSL